MKMKPSSRMMHDECGLIDGRQEFRGSDLGTD